MRFEDLIPAPQVASRFGVSRRTIARWLNDPEIAFPSPTIIKGRLYFLPSDIENWKKQRAVKASTGVAVA